MNHTKSRSQLRKFIGAIYFTLQRHRYWYFSNNDFATHLSQDFLSSKIFAHQSVLLRKLKDVDMYLQVNKVENLKIAVRKLNALIIEPGQVFSYWRQIGKPTAKKGYKLGMVLNQGKVKVGIGGGLCQLSNLIYWMTLHTPLTVIERWRHSYDVFPDVQRTLPFGSGATCSYPNIDLQIKNNTQQKFQLQLEVGDKFLKGKWLADGPIDIYYEIVEKDHHVQSVWWKGYTRNNKIFRRIFDKTSGELLGEEFITANEAIMMYDPLLTH